MSTDHPALTLDYDTFRDQVRQAATLPTSGRASLAMSASPLAARVQTILSSDPRRSVREALAQHPHLLRTVQLQLAADLSTRVRWALVKNPVLHPEAQLLLASDTSSQLRWHVVKNMELHPEVVVSLWESAEPGTLLQLSLLRTPHVPQDAVRAFALEGDRQWSASAASPSCPPDLLLRMSQEEFSLGYHLSGMAQNEAMPPEALRNVYHAILASPAAQHQLHLLATNPSLPESLVDEMRASGDPQVLTALVGSSRSSSSHLDQWVLSGDSSLRSRCAQREDLSASAFAHLAVDPDEGVRSSLVCNPSLPRGVLDLLVQDESVEVRENAAMRSDLLPEDFAHLVRLGGDEVLLEVAYNPAAPVDVLRRLPIHTLPSDTLLSLAAMETRPDEVMSMSREWLGSFEDLVLTLALV